MGSALPMSQIGSALPMSQYPPMAQQFSSAAPGGFMVCLCLWVYVCLSVSFIFCVLECGRVCVVLCCNLPLLLSAEFWYVRMCVCVCACVSVRERGKARACLCVRVRSFVCMCGYTSIYTRVCVYVRG